MLIRHFFGRLFRNPLISGDGDLSVMLVEIVAPLAVIGGLACLLSLQRRFFLSFIGERVDPSWLWVNESFHLSFAMILTGLVTLLVWDELLLDEADFANLGCLPIRPAALFFAKIVSLLLFVGLVSLGANVFSAVLFPGLLATGQGLASGLRWLAVHWAMLFAACLTVFCGCLALQGLLSPAPGRRVPRAADLLSRWLLVVVLLTVLVALPQIHGVLPQMKADGGDGLTFFPPMWFVGLYEVAMGRPDAVFEGLSRMALAALFGGALAAAAVFAVQYRRHLSGWVGSWRRSGGVGHRGGRSLFSRVFLRHPSERAIFHFVAQTLFRNQKQLLIWAAFLGLGAALLAASWGKLHWEAGAAGLKTPSWLNLSFVHLLVFFSVAGLRVVFSLPARLEANWIFKSAEGSDARALFRGVRKAAVVFGVLPCLPPALMIHVHWWGWPALAHCAYAVTLGIILAEVLFFGFRKIPFACGFVPENVNLRLKWPFSVAGFAVYVYGGALLESWLLRNTLRFAAGLALLAGVLALLPSLKRRMADDRTDEVVYEERSRPAMVRIQLN